MDQVKIWSHGSQFSHTKKILKRHIEHPEHGKSKKDSDKKEEELRDVIDGINRSVRYLVYYLLKTDTSFINFPVLLATVSQCGLEIGDINHSEKFPSNILPLIDVVFQENTKAWLDDQDNVSLSLDLGTYLDLTLLVVYFIGRDGSTRLAGCDLSSSKEGIHCAELAFRICLEGNIFITEGLLRAKVNAIVADGAFSRGNEPFKRRIRELFANNNMIFRWCVLHMCNRSHIFARGNTRLELDNLSEAERRRIEALIRVDPQWQYGVSALMNYVQNFCRTWRTGVRYTQLVIETQDFLRPKLFSSTRVCLYEYDHVKRYVEVMHYFDVPWHWTIMVRLYLLILFAEKIILKTIQKTTDQRAYVDRVFLGLNLPEPEGKTAMTLALRVGNDVIRENSLKLPGPGCSRGHCFGEPSTKPIHY